jgi:hypothetical protein
MGLMNATDLFRSTSGLLPERLLEDTIADIAIGGEGWAVPWAMFVDENRHCYLNGNYPIQAKAEGTAQMLVQRTRDGYIVDISQCSQKWSIGKERDYVGGCSNAIPIDRLIVGTGGDWRMSLELELADRPRVERAIAGALQSCIHSHGPIHRNLIGSASKRIYKALTSLVKSERKQSRHAQ